MALKFEELRLLQASEAVADGIWKQVVQWDPLIRDVVGKQIAKSADSIGANIAEAFGRFHYGEKVQFLYYARATLFETKYWLNRVLERELMPSNLVKDFASQLSDLARQLNAFISNLKAQRHSCQSKLKSITEAPINYVDEENNHVSSPLFTNDELQWIQTIPNI
jgi:four helix bundle protein